MNTLLKYTITRVPANLFRYFLLLLALMLFTPTGLTANSGPQSMLELRKLALQFIQNNYPTNEKPRIEFARWDQRINLNHCDNSKIQIFYPGQQQRLGYVSVGLRCTEKKSWTLYLRAHISVKQKIVFSKRFINRGQVITKEDLVIDIIEVSSSSTHYFHDTRDIIGKVAKRSILGAKKISAMALKPAMIIKRGQEVTIVARTAGILIRTKGKALSDGAQGQRVSVRNSRSKRKIQGTVVSANTVEVNM